MRILARGRSEVMTEIGMRGQRFVCMSVQQWERKGQRALVLPYRLLRMLFCMLPVVFSCISRHCRIVHALRNSRIPAYLVLTPTSPSHTKHIALLKTRTRMRLLLLKRLHSPALIKPNHRIKQLHQTNIHLMALPLLIRSINNPNKSLTPRLQQQLA